MKTLILSVITFLTGLGISVSIKELDLPKPAEICLLLVAAGVIMAATIYLQ